MNYKMIGRFLSAVLAIEAAIMLPAVAVSLFYREFSVAAAYGICIGLTLVFSLMLWLLTRRAGLDEHRLTGQLMIFVGMYFAGLIFLVPNLDRVEAMYRVAAGSAFVLPPGALMAFAGLAAVLLAGWAKELFFNKG